MQNKRLVNILLTAGLLLFIPLIAGFPWTRLGYVTAGVVLLITGLSIELVLRKVRNHGYKLAMCGAILATLVIIRAGFVSGD